MPDILFSNEPAIRLGVFAVVFGTMALLELALPFRAHGQARRARWPANLGVLLVDTLIVRLILPLGATSFALWVEHHGFGLFNILPWWNGLEIIVAILALDLTIWAQHVLFHKIPLLWRLHRMHHADTGFDLTTGLRFHPLEILLSLGVKFAAIALLGAPPLAVLLFEIVLNAGAIITHSNLRLPPAFEHRLRFIFVTPGMHRVHHSVERIDTDSNYGFNFAFWDRLFGTYREAPVPGDAAVVFGIDAFRAPREMRLDRMLTQPFRDDETPHPPP